MKINYPIVKNWALVNKPASPYMAPELVSRGLYGNVYGSKRFVDGTRVMTSSIVRMFEEQGSIIVETKNSKYLIRKEDIDAGYEAVYGGVWEKLLWRINAE